MIHFNKLIYYEIRKKTKFFFVILEKSPNQSSSPEIPPSTNKILKESQFPSDLNLEQLKCELEYKELLKFQTALKNRIAQEKELISELNTKILFYG